MFHFPDREFGEYSLSAEETAELLCKADVVSFDIFDTLIFRSVSRKEVFDNTGRTLGIENFGKIRADSENAARKEKKEPCINDIYRIIAVKAGLTDDAVEAVSYTHLDVYKRQVCALFVSHPCETLGTHA